MSDIAKPSVVIQRTSTRKRSLPEKLRDLPPDDLNQKQSITSPYKKKAAERLRSSEKKTDVLNPYQKTAPSRSKPISEAKPLSSTINFSKRTMLSPYKTPPRSSSATPSNHTVTPQTLVTTKKRPSVSISSKQSISTKLLKPSSTDHKFKPFQPLPPRR